MNNQKILVTGASGYVGMKIFNDLKKIGYEVFGTYKNTKLDGNNVYVDLTNEKEVNDLIDKIDPGIIIHLAADAHSKTCEEDPEYAKKINVLSTKYLVNKSKEKNIRFIHLSTFACFNPSNVYGETKLEAEKIVSTLENYVILRASLIVGLSPNIKSENFFNSLLKSIKSSSIITADTSWEFEMTSLSHLSEIIQNLIIRQDIKGLVIPVVAKGMTSRYKIAKNICKKLGIIVKSIDQEVQILHPHFDKRILHELNLPECTYEESIEQIVNDLT